MEMAKPPADTPVISQVNGGNGMVQRNRAVRILAKSIFRELTSQGYDERQIVNLAGELISEVTTTIASRSEPAQS